MQDDKTVLSQYEETLPVRLTVEQSAEKAQRLARTKGELEALEAGLRQVLADARARRRTLEAELSAAARAVRDGAEPQSVAVLVVADYQRGVAEHVRADTHEVLQERTRPLEPREKQVRLFDEHHPMVSFDLGWDDEQSNPRARPM